MIWALTFGSQQDIGIRGPTDHLFSIIVNQGGITEKDDLDHTPHVSTYHDILDAKKYKNNSKANFI